MTVNMSWFFFLLGMLVIFFILSRSFGFTLKTWASFMLLAALTWLANPFLGLQLAKEFAALVMQLWVNSSLSRFLERWHALVGFVVLTGIPLIANELWGLWIFMTIVAIMFTYINYGYFLSKGWNPEAACFLANGRMGILYLLYILFVFGFVMLSCYMMSTVSPMMHMGTGFEVDTAPHLMNSSAGEAQASEAGLMSNMKKMAMGLGVNNNNSLLASEFSIPNKIQLLVVSEQSFPPVQSVSEVTVTVTLTSPAQHEEASTTVPIASTESVESTLTQPMGEVIVVATPASQEVSFTVPMASTASVSLTVAEPMPLWPGFSFTSVEEYIMSLSNAEWKIIGKCMIPFKTLENMEVIMNGLVQKEGMYTVPSEGTSALTGKGITWLEKVSHTSFDNLEVQEVQGGSQMVRYLPNQQVGSSEVKAPLYHYVSLTTSALSEGVLPSHSELAGWYNFVHGLPTAEAMFIENSFMPPSVELQPVEFGSQFSTSGESLNSIALPSGTEVAAEYKKKGFVYPKGTPYSEWAKWSPVAGNFGGR